ncbi:MAG TPA: glutamate--cysteine ligase, partial [Micromonosporaceae bacterium]|nr:glutamate--cysteine ligase [Micromonosporaceae bacterium]
MGKTVESTNFDRNDYRRYRRKVRQCLDVFAQMLDHFRFDEDKPMTGLEIEINLVDRDGRPAMRNAE